MTVLCDLDGVIYTGQETLPGSAKALERLMSSGVAVYFITNNSTRTPAQGAEKITRLTGVEVSAEQLLSSPLAAVALLAPTDGPVFVVGEYGVVDAVARAGLEITEDPFKARSVLVGMTRSLSYELVGDAMAAIRNGARFIATNNDSTFPTEGRLMPGAGAIVAAIATASDVQPVVAGKPHRPMVELIKTCVPGPAWVIGDRVNTDIIMALDEPDWRSILVLTGVTAAQDPNTDCADFVVPDFAAAVDLVLSGAEPS